MFRVAAILHNTGENLKRLCWHADDMWMSAQCIPLNFNLLIIFVSIFEIRTPRSVSRCDELSVVVFFFFFLFFFLLRCMVSFIQNSLTIGWSVQSGFETCDERCPAEQKSSVLITQTTRPTWNAGLVASYLASIGLCEAHYAISRTGMFSQLD